MVVPSPPSPAELKAARRSQARARRRAFVAGLSAGERDQLENDLAEQLQPWIDRSSRVAGYHAVGSEIDPAPILRNVSASGHEIALPAFLDPNSPMTLRSGAAAELGPHAIPQPARYARAIVPDLVLVPLLAVDRDGNRLGQGGGHYDRALPSLREAGAIIIGIGWSMQLIDERLPVEPWDMALDGFASPEGVTMWR